MLTIVNQTLILTVHKCQIKSMFKNYHFMSILNMYTNVRMNVTETMTVYTIIDMPIVGSIIKRRKNTTLQVPKSNRKIGEIKDTIDIS